MRRLCILVLPQVFDSALTITGDVLAAGSRLSVPGGATDEGGPPRTSPSPTHAPPFTVEWISPGGRSVRTAGGLQVTSPGSLASADDADLVLVPGFSLPDGENSSTVDDYLQRRESRTAMGWLSRFRHRGGALAAGCTATFLLAEAGLLDGLQATTSWWLAEAFEIRYPKVDLQAHMMVTHQDGVTCAGAALAHTDLALRVLADLRGPAVADHVARHLLLDERVSQGRYMASDHLSHRHPEVLKAEAWIRAHLSQPIRVAEVAEAVALSPRTLARRLHASTGEAPLAFIQRLRVEHAVHLLETSTLAFDEIAANVGYQEPAGLRRVLKRLTGRRPSDFKRGSGP